MYVFFHKSCVGFGKRISIAGKSLMFEVGFRLNGVSQKANKKLSFDDKELTGVLSAKYQRVDTKK